MQMEDSERHKTCDCMVSNWVTIFFPPAFSENIWIPCRTVVIRDINAEVKVSDILLSKLRDKFVWRLEKMQRTVCWCKWLKTAWVNLRVWNVLRINYVWGKLQILKVSTRGLFFFLNKLGFFEACVSLKFTLVCVFVAGRVHVLARERNQNNLQAKKTTNCYSEKSTVHDK